MSIKPLMCILMCALLLIGCTAQEKVEQPQAAASPVDANVKETPKEAVSAGSSDPATAATPAASASVQDSSASSAAAQTAESVDVTVKAFRFGFEPSTITVKKGQKVKLIASSIDVAHGLAIPDYNINLRLDAGSSKTAEFVADKEGMFTMVCSIPCGEGHTGMKGTLVVEK